MIELATGWAILQRGLHPAAKLVLWHLCDRHTLGSGCFPSQDQPTADAEISRASLNTHLRKLEDAGLSAGIGARNRVRSSASRPATCSASRAIFR